MTPSFIPDPRPDDLIYLVIVACVLMAVFKRVKDIAAEDDQPPPTPTITVQKGHQPWESKQKQR